MPFFGRGYVARQCSLALALWAGLLLRGKGYGRLRKPAKRARLGCGYCWGLAVGLDWLVNQPVGTRRPFVP